MKNHYIKATIALLEAGKEPAEVVRGLEVVLEKRGHSKLLASILRGASRAVGSKQPAGTAVVTVADTGSYHVQQAEIEAAVAALEATAHESHVVADPTVIGGFKVSTITTTLDQTYKTKLLELYRAITA